MTNCTRNIILLRLLKIALHSSFILPILVLFFRDIIRLSFREFMTTEAFFAACLLILEVPTGWLSDMWKRKHTLLLGVIVSIGGFTLLMNAGAFWHAMLAQGILGLGVSLISGTNSALLYDSLHEAGRTHEYRKQEGLMSATGLYTIALCCFCGGFMYEINPFLPLQVTLVILLFGIPACLLMVEPERHKQEVQHNPLADMIITMRYALHGHPVIGGLIMLGAVTFATTKLFLWTQQTYYTELNLPESWFGILTATGFLIGGLGSHFGHWFDGKISHRNILLILIALVGLASIGAGIHIGYHGIILLLLGSAIWGFGWPHLQDALNKRIESARRATILSTANLMIQLTFIPASIMLGWSADHFGIGTALLILGGLIGLTGSIAATLIYRKKEEGP